MRKLILFISLFLSLASGSDCVAQAGKSLLKGGVKALTAGAANALPQIVRQQQMRPVSVPSVAAVSGMVSHRTGMILPKSNVEKWDSLLELRKISFPAERVLQAVMSDSCRHAQQRDRLQAVYRKWCAEAERGKLLNDTLAWVRMGNKAAELGLDSIAADCFERFVSYAPSVAKIAGAIDSLMDDSRHYVPPMIDACVVDKFCAYWENPDPTERVVSDFITLAEIVNRYAADCRKVDLVQGMLHYFAVNYREAGLWFERATRSVVVRSELYDPYGVHVDGAASAICYDNELLARPENLFLFRVTAYCMYMSERYADMLSLFGELPLDRYVAENPYTACLLYRAALFVSNPDLATKYADMGLAADEAYFMEQYKELYYAVYDDFLENPHLLANLDFLAEGMDSCGLSYVDMACDLSGKLPAAPDDDKEHYYEETLIPYREALLEIAGRSDSLHRRELTPDNAVVRVIAESVRAGFLDSAEQGRTNLKTLYKQLYEKRRDPQYYKAIILAGIDCSAALYYRQPKEALKVMCEVLPVIKKLDKQEPDPFGAEFNADLYSYMADLYRKNNKPKKAESMQKLADERASLTE